MDFKNRQLLAIIMTCLSVAIAKPLQLSRKHSYSNKQILYHESNTRNTTYLYAVCSSAEQREEKICDVRLERVNFDGSNETATCPLTLTATLGNTVHPSMDVVLVGEDKAAIFWTEELAGSGYPDSAAKFHLNIANVHMRDGCRKNEMRTLLPVERAAEAHGPLNVLPFVDTYDVILPGVSCGNELCKGTFDVNGKVIANISSWDPFGRNVTEHIVNLNKHSRKIGYLTVALHQNDEIQFIFAKDNGAKVLKTWNKAEYVSPEVMYSIGYNTLGACFLYDHDYVNCTLFDFDGAVKQEASFRHDRRHFRSIHNLPEGFLTITKECFADGKFVTPQWMCPHNLKYFLTRYDGQSRRLKKIEIAEHDWDSNDAFEFFKNDAGEQCVTITNYEYHQFLQVDSYCFPDF